MSEISEKLAEPFEHSLHQQVLQLDLAAAELEENKDLIEQWPVQKRKITAWVLKPMKKWAAEMKRSARPLALRAYKREKRRLLRFKTLAWSCRSGFRLSIKAGLLWTLNLVRILLILSFYVGGILLVLYGLMKVFNLIGK